MMRKFKWKPSGWLIQSALQQARCIQWTDWKRDPAYIKDGASQWLDFTAEQANDWIEEHHKWPWKFSCDVSSPIPGEPSLRDGEAAWHFEAYFNLGLEERLSFTAPTLDALRAARSASGLARKARTPKLTNANLRRSNGRL